jgi:hypothetical protein
MYYFHIIKIHYNNNLYIMKKKNSSIHRQENCKQGYYYDYSILKPSAVIAVIESSV